MIYAKNNGFNFLKVFRRLIKNLIKKYPKFITNF